MFRKILIAVLVLMVLAVFVFSRTDVSRIYLPTATGITAKQICSLHFVSGFGPERARTLYVDPLLEPAAGLISATVRAETREVSASLLGLFGQRAVYRPGLGCTLVHGSGDFDADLSVPLPGPNNPLELDARHRDARFDRAALTEALNRAFAEPEQGQRATLAVAVLHQGRLVAERYAAGVDRDSRLHGWSMTKSVTAALAGALALEGRIDVEAPGAVDASDHVDISLEHLLRMTGGLDIAERADGFDPNSDMLFTESDMADWAAGRARLHPPGEHWQYMSGNTVLAARALQDELGDTLSEQVKGLRERLFLPLGIKTAVLEVDEAGTFQGSSYMYATAHDWARLAQLFLDDGNWRGRQVLAPGWTERVTTSTAGSREGAYGMGFWLGHPSADAPAGIYYMSGFQAQYAYVMPEQELVVVRLGATHGTGSGTQRLVLDVVDALRPRASLSSR